MWDTYATNNTILYLQYKKICDTYLQRDTYTTNSIIPHALPIYNGYLHYLRYGLPTPQKKKKQKIKGAGKYGKILVNWSSNSKKKKRLNIFSLLILWILALNTLNVEARKKGEGMSGRKGSVRVRDPKNWKKVTKEGKDQFLSYIVLRKA